VKVPSATRQIDLTGGESVYCINAYQIDRAREMFAGDDESAARVRATMSSLESDLSRNERAAVAMLLLERLNARPVDYNVPLTT